MRKYLVVFTVLAVVFGLALGLGLARTASAAPAAQTDTELTLPAADLDGIVVEDEALGGPGHPGPGRPGLVRALQCTRITRAVHQACPCEGLKDASGTVVPWASHEAYVTCVTDKVAAIEQRLKDAGKEVPAKCLKGIVDRATASKIGTEGFVCGRQAPRPRVQCARASTVILKACPCAGPDGNAWASHEAFMECVNDKADQLVAKGAAEECITKIIERLDNSKIGEPGFECPKHRGPRDPGDEG